jgi:glycosyltransferase involved in cell wall biosynthesis/predicted O-methyltransferase YrrM
MYKIRNSLIPIPENHRKPILETLDMYDRGEDLTNSPLIKSRINLTHIDVWKRDDKDQALQDRQKELIKLYENIKSNGYNGSKVLCWFDDEGNIKLYDGYHRLSILEHLEQDIPISIETEWNGVDGTAGRDFPLTETLKNRWLYQPVFDPRLKDWKVARPDSQQRLDYILKNLVGKTVLDIGCSEGFFSRELAKRGYEVTGIDSDPSLIAVARYLSILEGQKIDFYHVTDWSKFLKPYDNILFLCVIHNDMKKIGVEAGLKKLELLRGKAQRLFFEAPQETGEKEWNREGFPTFNFKQNVKKLESALDMSLRDTWSLTPNSRPIFMFEPQWAMPDSRNQYYPLFETLRTKPCRKILEIGTHNGKNAVAMIKSAASQIPENEITYYGFDLFEDMTDSLQGEEYSPPEKVKKEEVEEFIKSHTTARVTLIRGNTRQTLKTALPKMDLIFIDGGHSIETIRSDWANCQQFIKDDTIVYFDDYNDEMPFIGPYLITKELSSDYEFEVLPQTNYYKRPYGRLKCQLLRVTKKSWWNLKTWLDPKGRRQHCKPIFDTITSKPCRNILEIGVNRGYTAFVMIKNSIIPEEEIHYYGFDLFEDIQDSDIHTERLAWSSASPAPIQKVKDFLERNTKAHINLFKGNTRSTLKEADLPLMDLIHIDGGHSIETMRNDWFHASKLMHKDTVAYADGCNDELPSEGSYFLLNELSSKYSAQVMPDVDFYYPNQPGRGKNQLLKIQLKPSPILRTNHFRFHLLGLPHSKTVKDWGPCAFTQLVYRFSKMMTDLGHEVYHYGTEGSNPQCTEHIDVLTEEIQRRAYGDWDPYKQLWIHNGSDLAYTTARKNAIEEINKRKQPRDILLVTNGHWLKEVANLTGVQTVEPFVGYLGCYSRHKVFPSYAWMHHIYGLQAKQKDPKENFVTGNWYDCVIPHFFDPGDHTFNEEKEDYFFYFGRLIQRKGIHIAVDITKRIGAKLIVAGQPLWPDKLEESLKHVGCLQPHVEYKGVLTMAEIDRYVSRARASFLPSLYMEPFGLVIVESLLSGTPVITTDWGSFPEIVPQGRVGYRCRTADDFIWACNNVDKIDPKECRDYAIKNFSMERIGRCYEEYFMKIHDLFGKGWYEIHPERTNLDWLK